MIIFTNTIVQHIKRRWSFGTMLLGRVRGATWNDIHYFFATFFLSKSTQEGKGDKKWSDNTHTKNRFYFTKTEHFFYIDTQIQPKICVIRALPTPMLIKNEKNRENTATTVVIQNISQDLPTGWAEWLLGGWKRLEAFFLIWMRPLCCNLLNRVVRFNWRRIKF